MTPLISLLIAILVAQLAPNTRAVIGSLLVPVLAATALQTWDIGAAWGSNPPNTVSQVSYWVVQLIIIAVMTGVALGLFRLRVRRCARRGQSLIRPAFTGRRGSMVVFSSTVAMSVFIFAAEYTIYRHGSHHGHGAGHIPWTGVLGIVLGLVALVGLASALIRASMDDRLAARPTTSTTSATSA